MWCRRCRRRGLCWYHTFQQHDIYSARSCIELLLYLSSVDVWKMFRNSSSNITYTRFGHLGHHLCMWHCWNISRLRFSSLQNRLRLGTYLNALSSSPVTSSLVIDMVLASASKRLEMLLLESLWLNEVCPRHPLVSSSSPPTHPDCNIIYICINLKMTCKLTFSLGTYLCSNVVFEISNRVCVERCFRVNTRTDTGARVAMRKDRNQLKIEERTAWLSYGSKTCPATRPLRSSTAHGPIAFGSYMYILKNKCDDFSEWYP